MLPSPGRAGDLATEKEPDSVAVSNQVPKKSERSATLPMEETMRSSARKKQLEAPQDPVNPE